MGGFALGRKVIVSLSTCFLGLPGPASLLRTRYQPLGLGGEGSMWGCVCWDKCPSSSSLSWGGGSGDKLLEESLSQGALELLLHCSPLPHTLVCPAGNPTAGSPLTSVPCNA